MTDSTKGRDAVVTIFNTARVAVNADWFAAELAAAGFEIAPIAPAAAGAEPEPTAESDADKS